MLQDALTSPGEADLHADVCIVGGGPAAMALAAEFTRTASGRLSWRAAASMRKPTHRTSMTAGFSVRTMPAFGIRGSGRSAERPMPGTPH